MFVHIWGCLKIGVPQSFVLHTKKQGLGALLGTPILGHPHIAVFVFICHAGFTTNEEREGEREREIYIYVYIYIFIYLFMRIY